jgi:hypothetical protein
MGKKKGKAGKIVPPAAPDEAQEPDEADELKATKKKSKGKRSEEKRRPGQKKTKPHKPPPPEKAKPEEEEPEEEEKKTSWIEIELVGEDDGPVPGEKYRITLPDGETVAEGTLDNKGLARVEGFEAGTCKVSFPDLDKEAWEKA